jgi:hypothetical protein
MTITTNPRYELPYALHDGWGGKEWFFTVAGKQHGSYETEDEAFAAMNRVMSGMIAERRAREMNAELPDDVRDVMRLKGML